jgi:hypothetical protein
MKKWIVMGFVLALAALAAGCTPSKAAGALPTAAQDEGAAVEAASTVTGEVESIVGNAVTLKLGAVKDGAEGGEDAQAQPSAAPAKAEGEPPAGMPEGGGTPEGTSFSFGMSGGNGKSVSAAVELELTGETAEYLLPVGMRIGAGDYAQVASGMALRLSLDAEGNVIAADILSR